MSNSSQHDPASPWLKPDEAAEYLGIALGTLRNWTSAKFVPFSKRGGIVRYHRNQLDQWLLSKSCKGRSTFANATTTD
ncbi:helix-turn-helix domain-containing protein [Lignipirellula cremea]|uniref:Helix-turn-helix domain protein n=1 Tax=Lignipirellula cremea TaxID=2528010 RepID=A0A518E3U8_9BACT|nr:helix-turn-helix domain-containing protein [Lignipirellula cremea]QDU98769.1 Helix-turn-helix domain protein [Lignipirellula cremea]